MFQASRRIFACLAIVVASGAAHAQESPPASRCLAIAQSAPKVVPVNFIRVQEGMTRPSPGGEVTIRYVRHSTFLITTPGGVQIATDYSGYAGPGVVPDIVTMNRAHSSHFTSSPDPRIPHVLPGWNPEGGPARHYLQVGDMLVRNVPTDIRGWSGSVPDGNSIFIFEVAQLCIGHLGHLHHVLAPEDLGWIGQLDIVMAPVDGSYTIDQAAMMATLRVVKARLVLPMHYFGEATLARFLSFVGDEFAVEMSDSPQVTVSTATLPKSPKVLVLPGY